MSLPYFQYMKVVLTDGEHQFSYNLFMPCSKKGVTDDEIIAFLSDRHNVPSDAEYEEEWCDEGMYFTESNAAAGVFHESRGNICDDQVLYKANSPEMKQLVSLMPEMFYE